MRVALVYDCLYPWTVGGAERWMRALAEALAAEGHDVTYLTRRQWDPGEPPRIPGVRVIAVSRADELYDAAGARRIGPPLRFGRGVLGHLLRHRGDYDVVHSCSFPYFGVLAAGLARTRPLFVDWFEVWSPAYWRGYLGGPAGLAGWAVQRACARVPQQAFVFSRRHGDRLRGEGLRGEPIRLGGLYSGSLEPPAADGEREPLVVFAGRHIPEKGVTAIPATMALVREQLPGARALVLGDGPQRPALLDGIAAMGLQDAVSAPGFVAPQEVDDALARAACLLLPSVREGYGLVVIESAARGTPVVVADGPDNAAVELVVPGVNGAVAASARPDDLASAVVAVLRGGAELRARTAAWFAEHAERLTVQRSLGQVLEAYARR